MSRGPDGGGYVDDQYRCKRCGNRRHAVNTLGHRPSQRHLICAACGGVTTNHGLVLYPTTPTQETTMTTNDQPSMTIAEALSVVASELRSEAERRGFCDDYDQFVDRVNERVGFGALTRLKPKARKYLLTIELEATTAPDTARIQRGLTDNIRRGTSVLPAGTRVGGVTVEERS